MDLLLHEQGPATPSLAVRHDLASPVLRNVASAKLSINRSVASGRSLLDVVSLGLSQEQDEDGTSLHAF